MSESYYGRNIVKPHVWSAAIPLYFWIGGTAGAAAVHAAVARARGDAALATVQQRVALAGALVAPVLLVADLGVPSRFINMLRVFKPTSPMSVGSWVLSGFGSAIGAAAVAELAGLEAASRACGLAAAVLGPVLATYTAVLVADTATPVWHDARRTLPFLFVSSAVAGAGALGSAFAPAAERGSARRLMIAGAIAMIAAARVMDRETGALLAEPYRTGKAGSYRRLSTRFALAGALLGAFGRASTTVTRLAALCTAAAGIYERFAVLQAGTQSALDPTYVVHPQRERLEAR